MATAHLHTGGGLNSSSGGELKLYLKGKRNMVSRGAVVDLGFPRSGGTNPPGGTNIQFCQIFPKTA